MNHLPESLSIRLAEILRSDMARCRACGASFPRTARVEDLCLSCRLPRHDTASSNRRIALLAVAALSLTALSAFARLTVGGPATSADNRAEAPTAASVPIAGADATPSAPQAASTPTDSVATAPASPASRAGRLPEAEDAEQGAPADVLVVAKLAAFGPKEPQVPALASPQVPVLAVPQVPAAPPTGPQMAAPRVAKVPAPAAPPVFKRRQHATEEELLAQLASAPEVGIGIRTNAVIRAYKATYAERAELRLDPGASELTTLFMVVPAVRQLPYKNGPLSQLTVQQGQTLERLAGKLHAYLDEVAPREKDGKRHVTAVLRTRLTTELRGKRPEWARVEALPAMLQILMHEDAPIRGLLVELLAQIPEKAATEALAQRAVFDLDADVRGAAIAALRSRSGEVFRSVFIKAMRYPWPPAADHAAEALVALADRGAVPDLVASLQGDDPGVPRALSNGRMVVQEMVRTNHLANCMLCHPPSVNGAEAVLAVDPVHVTPTDITVTSVSSGPRSYPYPGSTQVTTDPSRELLIRADITFLRQDFSVQQPVLQAAPGSPPVRVRFDYLVQRREATKTERDRARSRSGEHDNYPQRESVLFALRELTGKDAGTTAAAWQDLFPNAQDDVEAARLSRQLVSAGAVRQEVLLEQLKDAKGPANTLAIARAIPSLKGSSQKKAREVLAERLGRMTPNTLRDKLTDDEPEVRRAAITACVRTGKKELAGDLVKLLDDAHRAISREAEDGLKELSGRTFTTSAAWRDWWRNEGQNPVARHD
jgi:HEAT repeat protein